MKKLLPLLLTLMILSACAQSQKLQTNNQTKDPQNSTNSIATDTNNDQKITSDSLCAKLPAKKVAEVTNFNYDQATQMRDLKNSCEYKSSSSEQSINVILNEYDSEKMAIDAVKSLDTELGTVSPEFSGLGDLALQANESSIITTVSAQKGKKYLAISAYGESIESRNAQIRSLGNFVLDNI